MSRNRQIVIVSGLMILFIVLLVFLISKLNPNPAPVPTALPIITEISPSAGTNTSLPPTSGPGEDLPPDTHFGVTALATQPAPYQIENGRLIACDQADIDHPACTLPGQGDRVCLAWTERQRKINQSLRVNLFDNRETRIFERQESTRPETNCAPNEERCCRVVQVDTQLLPGNFPLTLILSAQGVDFSWKITCPAPPVGWASYKVQSGDTLETIRAWYSELTLEKLMQANCLSAPIIFPGQELYVPETPPPGKIIGIVFADPNNNHTQEGGEQRVSGIVVPITDSQGKFVRSTFTDGNGRFEVELPAGTYFVLQFQISLHPNDEIQQSFAVVPVSP